MSNDLEFAIKQDIRNNPVVREVDLDQKREFMKMLGWAALAIGTLMFALLPRTSTSNLNYKIGKLKEAIAAEQEYQRQYTLELAYLTRPQEIRRRATLELHMITPPDDLVLPLQLVPAPASASSAIVASARR